MSTPRFGAVLASARSRALAGMCSDKRKELTMSNLDPNLAPSFGHVPDFEETERARRGLIEEQPPVGEPEPDDG